MDKQAARNLVKETLQNPFDKDRFYRLSKELLNHVQDAPFTYRGNYIPDAYEPYIQTLERIGKYDDPDGNKIDILIAKLKKGSSLERARTMQRNFIAWYLNGSRGGDLKDAALVAFVSPDSEDWRFSLVTMDYVISETPKGRVRAKAEYTPARRFSFLVGEHENSHTAQSRLVPIIEDDAHDPTLKQIEEAFNIEKATKEFFEKYRELYHRVKDELDKVVDKDRDVKKDFKEKGVDTSDFAKKLLGQIVFLYFLQKKGWFGVKRGQPWGSGSRQFLRELFDKKHGDFENFFNDILEPLFYEALRLDRPEDYYSRFDCRIPFLNGGLFDPLNDYDWIDTDILLPNDLFSNDVKTKEGDKGTGILDIFDRYNFTVKEDEPLEKEVAVDPEMLGKVFENLLEVKDRKSKGTYYTPREIVHYMCQESLINYLATELEGKVSKEDIEKLIKEGDTWEQFDATHVEKKSEDPDYKGKYGKSLAPKSIVDNAVLIDEKLASIRVCDPAVGSGAFPVGMMNEIVRARGALTPHIGNDKNRTPYHFKRHAIQECLYGVDIDPGAVEIAKLRLWLSLVVDEEDRKTIQPLPNLDYKIVCGNSLLGYPYEPSWTTEIERLKKDFFQATNPKVKQRLKSQIDTKLKGFLANSEGSLGYKVDFDFKIFFSEVFHEKAGFDVVIANPPYVNVFELQRDKKLNKQHYRTNFKSASGAFDLYVLFHEKSIMIARPEGVITLISPNKFLSAEYAINLRKYILDHSVFHSLLDLSSMRIFDASVYPVVSIYLKHKCDEPIQIFRGFGEVGSITFEEVSVFDQSSLEHSPNLVWSFLIGGNSGIYEKLNGFAKITKVCTVSASFSVDEAYKAKPLITDLPQKSKLKDYKAFLISSNIHRYYHTWGNRAISYLKTRFMHPFIKLDRDVLSAHRIEQIKGEKILIAAMTKELRAIWDSEGDYAAGIPIVILTNLDTDGRILLALLNSHLYSYYFNQLFSSLSLSGGYLRIGVPQISALPFNQPSTELRNQVIKFVDKILAITKDDDYLSNPAKQAKVREYEREIDQLVYNLYDLTPEEIRIVEGEV